jgi:hypothetical protein
LASKGGGNTISPTFHLHFGEGVTARKMADEVKRLLQIELDEHLQGSLI